MSTDFIVFSDFHFQKNLPKSYLLENNRSFWLDCQLKVLDQIFSTANNYGIKLLLFNGDLFEEKNRIPQDLYNEVWEAFKKYSSDYRIIFNSGNHDLITLSRESSLKPFSDIVEIITEPTDIKIGKSLLRVLPYGRVIHNLTVPDGYEHKFLFIHEDISELQYNNSNFRKNTEIKVDMFEGWDKVFCGHIHMPQEYKNIINIGSPMPVDWGEKEEKKRFLVIQDAQVKSVFTEYPKFISVSNLDVGSKELIKNDNYNYYRVDVSVDQLSDPIFKKFNVSSNVIKKKVKVKRLLDTLSPEEEINNYIKLVETDLDKKKLFEIGMSLRGIKNA